MYADKCDRKCLAGKTTQHEQFFRSMDAMERTERQVSVYTALATLRHCEGAAGKRKREVFAECYGYGTATIARYRKRIEAGWFSPADHGNKGNSSAKRLDKEKIVTWFTQFADAVGEVVPIRVRKQSVVLAYEEDSASADDNHLVLTMDYAQNMALPHVAKTPAQCAHAAKQMNYVYTERQGGKGPNEIISMLYHYLEADEPMWTVNSVGAVRTPRQGRPSDDNAVLSVGHGACGHWQGMRALEEKCVADNSTEFGIQHVVVDGMRDCAVASLTVACWLPQSTYCNNMHEFCAASGRMTYVVNLDPAADHFEYPVAFDIRDLISVEDVMEELGYGPNGGLVYCMEYLVQNLDWLQDLLTEYSDDDYFIFDCPGQIELYSHLPVMKQLCDALKDWGFAICGVYLIDSLFIADPAKFISGVLCSLSAMVQLELPHINVLTKCDLVDEKELSKYLDPSSGYLLENLANSSDPKWRPLSTAICNVINDFSMVAFVPMNINKEESVEAVLMHVDHAINFGEDLEPREPRDDAEARNTLTPPSTMKQPPSSTAPTTEGSTDKTIEEHCQLQRVFRLLAFELPLQRLDRKLQRLEQKLSGGAVPEKQSKKTRAEYEAKRDHYTKERNRFHNTLNEEANNGKDLVCSKFHVEPHALLDVYERLGWSFPHGKTQIDDILWEINDNLDGILSYDEFEKSYLRARCDRTGLEPSEIFFLTCFLMFDKECSGRLALDDAMRIFYLKYGDSMEDEMEVHFGTMLDQGMHSITFREYRTAIVKRQGELIDQFAAVSKSNKYCKKL
ncbi:TPA: hypothetical protein N0F65_001307 [Lagenidium giganteum]|uniref:GPN-loop GTPase 3 n=1 Tax=Lagenidium giganteum TaxID=4803 RepID=A0AAV2Z172_9STRA|nr:TPA: hypothetical protein N0F65_001307 [Lagenidium giganteum]